MNDSNRCRRCIHYILEAENLASASVSNITACIASAYIAHFLCNSLASTEISAAFPAENELELQ